MEYLAQPPEITSTRIYSGPGSAPMTAAASAWSSLAAELKSAATAYRSILGQLTGEQWLGPASASMVAAVSPYVMWVDATAEGAERAAAQARAAAAAYETAHALTVPPVAVTTNRVRLDNLVTTNILGQNTAAIANTEIEHGEMWAQDTIAMQGYHTESTAATNLNEFTPPPDPTNPGADAGTGTGSAVTAAPRASSALQNLLRLPGAAEGTDPNPPGIADDILNDPNYNLTNQGLNQVINNANLQSNNICAVWRGVSGVLGMQKLGADLAKGASSAASGTAGAASGAANAASGAAGSIGGLSVPPAWVPPMPAASALGPVSGGSWVPVGPAAASAVPSAGGILGTAPMAPPAGMPGMPGVPAAGAGGAGFRGFGGPRYGAPLTVMPKTSIGG